MHAARFVIGANPSGCRSGALAIPQDRQNRVKRCGALARQLDYLHAMIWLLVAVSSYAQKSYGRTTMRAKFLAITALLTSGVVATAFLVQSLSSSSAQTQARQLPEYTASGDLVLPKNFHEWIYVGSPLTPNALNGGEAGFPEYHTSTSSRAHTRYSRRRMNSPKGRSCSRSCNSRCRARTPMVRARSLRGGAISPGVSTAPT